MVEPKCAHTYTHTHTHTHTHTNYTYYNNTTNAEHELRQMRREKNKARKRIIVSMVLNIQTLIATCNTVSRLNLCARNTHKENPTFESLRIFLFQEVCGYITSYELWVCDDLPQYGDIVVDPYNKMTCEPCCHLTQSAGNNTKAKTI